MPTLNISKNIETQDTLDSSKQGPLHQLALITKGTAWFLVSALIAILLLESVFNIAQFGEQEYAQIDPSLGLTHLENKMITWREEGYSHGRTNSSGFVDVERTVEKPAGVFRIAVLGDSFTEALQVQFSQRFTTLLESKLNQPNHRKFQVLNCGISGFGAGQEYLTYVNRIAKFDPDITIVCMNEWEPDKNTIWPSRPTFSLSHSGQLQVRWNDFDSWRHSAAALPLTCFEWGRRNSRVWGVLLQTYNELKNDATYKRTCDLCQNIGLLKLVSNSPRARSTSAEEPQVGSNREILCRQAGLTVDPHSPEEKQAVNIGTEGNSTAHQSPEAIERHWAITQSIIKNFNELCLQHHSKLILVVLPIRCQKQSSEKRFESVACSNESNQIPLLNTVPSFLAQNAAQTDALFLEGHLSAKGHALIADALNDFLQRRSLVPSER